MAVRRAAEDSPEDDAGAESAQRDMLVLSTWLRRLRRAAAASGRPDVQDKSSMARFGARWAVQSMQTGVFEGVQLLVRVWRKTVLRSSLARTWNINLRHLRRDK